MINSEAIKYINKLYSMADLTDEYGDKIDTEPYEEAIAWVAEALEQQPCVDCISREEAIKTIQRYGVGTQDFDNYTPEQAERFVIQKLSELPSVGKDINAPTTDYISRETLDRELYERFHEEGNTITMITLGAVRNYIKELPSVTPATQWHMVEDGLPKENGDYLVTYGKNTYMAHYSKNIGWVNEYGVPYKKHAKYIVAWMPLPEWEE